jgi:hypothetical protein
MLARFLHHDLAEILLKVALNTNKLNENILILNVKMELYSDKPSKWFDYGALN